MSGGPASSCGLPLFGGIQVRPQVVTGDPALGGALDGETPFGGDPLSIVQHVMNRWLRDPHHRRQRSFTAKNVLCPPERGDVGLFHEQDDRCFYRSVNRNYYQAAR